MVYRTLLIGGTKVVSICVHAFVTEHIRCIRAHPKRVIWWREHFRGRPIINNQVFLVLIMIIAWQDARVRIGVFFSYVLFIIFWALLFLISNMFHFQDVKFKREFRASLLRLLKRTQLWKHFSFKKIMIRWYCFTVSIDIEWRE